MVNQLYQKILHSKKIKYEVLDKILKPYLPPPAELLGKYKNNINIFINIGSLYNSLFNPELLNLFETLNRQELYMLAADIANLCGHYRHYLASKVGCYTTFFLYYNVQPATELLKNHPTYKESFYRKRYAVDSEFTKLNKMFQINFKILKELVPYLPHIYLIDSLGWEAAVLPTVILKKFFAPSRNTFNVFITLDLAETQYHELGIILRPKADKSYIIDNLEHTVVSELSTAKILHKDLPAYDSIAKTFLKEIFCYGGYPKFDIAPIGTLSHLKLLKLLYSAIYIPPTKKSNVPRISLASTDRFLDLSNYLLAIGMVSPASVELAKSNRELLDYAYMTELLPSASLQRFKSQITDIVDLAALKKINHDYYSQYPIFLDFLLEGETY
jgi:hypothetical protein